MSEVSSKFFNDNKSRFIVNLMLCHMFLFSYRSCVKELAAIFPSNFRMKHRFPQKVFEFIYEPDADVRCQLMCTGGLCTALLKKLLSGEIRGKFQLARSIISRCIVSPSEKKTLSLSYLLEQLCDHLIQEIKILYENDSITNDALFDLFKRIIKNFSQSKDIELVNIFAILNSLRKNGVCFNDCSKKVRICFSDRPSFKYGKTSIEITLDSSIFFERFIFLINQLEPTQQDLLSLMYMKVLRDFNVVPKIDDFDFELTIEFSYDFWHYYLSWDTQRSTYLTNCKKNVICRDFFSKKDVGYYSSSNHTRCDSFQIFFSRNYHIINKIGDRCNDYSFNPIN